MTITVDWSTPVFATDWIRAGLIAATPTIISRPARAGMATKPTTSPKASTTIAITTPATSSASRVRAPACTTSDEADIDPPTGIPWKSPARTLPVPWPMKSRVALAGEPSGFGKPAEIPAPCTSPTKASDTAGTRRKSTSPSTGRLIAGNVFGIVARSRTCSTTDSFPFSIAASAEPAPIATTMPSAPRRVRCRTTISRIVTVPTTNDDQSIRPGCVSRSSVRVRRCPPAAS